MKKLLLLTTLLLVSCAKQPDIFGEWKMTNTGHYVTFEKYGWGEISNSTLYFSIDSCVIHVSEPDTCFPSGIWVIDTFPTTYVIEDDIMRVTYDHPAIGENEWKFQILSLGETWLRAKNLPSEYVHYMKRVH